MNKESKKSVWKKIGIGILSLFTLPFLVILILFIETSVVDASIAPAQNPSVLFSDMRFEDSIASTSQKPEYLLYVKKYVEYMIVNGRDRYGKETSPLFATTLDRRTGNVFKSNPPKAPKGIRDRDRNYRGANPSLQSSLYGLMYEMAEITGNSIYAKEADKGIEWFWRNCQIPRTNLMPWGEHMGWDFFKERPIYWNLQFWIHELKGYGHYERAWELAPEASERFAMALWDHQIYAKTGEKAGEFSRHANGLMHFPLWGKGFPSHGGKYIEVWARAYEQTGNKEFLTAISTLLDYFERNTSPESGAIVYATKFPEHYSLGHNMGLAQSLYRSMNKVPDSLAQRMKSMADRTDALYLSFDHDPTVGGVGFVKYAHVHTLEPGDYRYPSRTKFSTDMWSSGYGASNSISSANSCLSRYYATGIEKYKELFLIAANAYYDADAPESKVLYPKNYSGPIGMMRRAYQLTGEARFLNRAVDYAELGIESLLDDTSPLPKASNTTEHYEAITGANNFMNALLGLWMDLNKVNKQNF